MALALLAVIVFFSFGIEAAMGFGCTVLAVTFAAHLFPLEQLLPVLVGLNLVVSVTIVVRHREAIEWRVLLRRIFPLMALGMPLGMAAFHLASGPLLKLGFGLFVVLLASVELQRLLRHRAEGTALARPLGLWLGAAVLLGAGLTHGLYASGGPLAVYFSSRELRDKSSFRSTLSTLWLALNAILMVGYVVQGAVGRESLVSFALMLAPVVAGIFAGEWLHGRINERTFRLLVFVLLLAGGIVLVAAVRW
jgi:uncharacterized membrane protein YfcA